MALHRWERLGYRWFGRAAARAAKNNPYLSMSLQRAHIFLRPEVYLSTAYLFATFSFILAILPVLLLGAARAAGVSLVPNRIFIFMIPAPFVVAGIVYLLALIMPDMRARGRARDMDAKLPYALNYISTMASAGATPEAIFASLAQQSVYGEVANEAAWITRDLKLLGTDIVRALSMAIDRSPSTRFQDLLQGGITTLTSGGDLKSYFLQKSEQFLYENRSDQKKFLEGLGVLAESFVTVVVAAPLFLIVILSVMSSFGGSAQETLLIGYILVFVLIPFSQAGFAYTIKLMTPEA